MPTNDIMNVRQAAAALGESVRTVQRRINTGELEATKLPGRTGAYVIDARSVTQLRRRIERDAHRKEQQKTTQP